MGPSEEQSELEASQATTQLGGQFQENETMRVKSEEVVRARCGARCESRGYGE